MNPLQPKIIKVLQVEYNAFVTNVITSSFSGTGDLIVCIDGRYFMFEIKYKNDTASTLQKIKVNDVIKAGGKAYFISSIEELRYILDNHIKPVLQRIKTEFEL